MGNSKSKTQSIGETDVVVFLVGPAGAGKSTLMVALDQDHRANRNPRSLDPSTKEVQAWTYTFKHIPYNIVLVDTPSFHTRIHDFDAEIIMMKWITASKFSDRCRQSGILYLHNLATHPEERSLLMQKHLDTFANTFPPKSMVPSRVYIIPTIDKGLKPGSRMAEKHFARLQDAVESLNARWNASMFPHRFRDEPEIAYNAVRTLLEGMNAGS